MARSGTNHKGGRPKGGKASHTLKAEQAREYFVQRVVSEMNPIITAQLEAAKGLYYETADKKIYQREPDIQASKYLVDQTIGRPKETVEMQGDIILKIDG